MSAPSVGSSCDANPVTVVSTVPMARYHAQVCSERSWRVRWLMSNVIQSALESELATSLSARPHRRLEPLGLGQRWRDRRLEAGIHAAICADTRISSGPLGNAA